jgi:hypothetical protein
MPYVGNPLADAFSSRVKQDLTGQSGTSFTLTHAVSHANDLSVYINHVRQEPTTAYSVNGTTLTTTGSVAGTDDFYIIYDELAVQSISHPTDQALTATSGTFTSGLVGTTATFSGAVSGTTGTFSGAISGTLGTAAQTNITSVGTLSGLTVDGDVGFTGANYNISWDKSDNALEFQDNAKLTFGAGNDLQIYHTPGTGTFIDEANDGDLFIRSSRVTIHKYTGETMINAAADGAVSLYYDDSKKFQTSNTGVEIYNGSTGSSPNITLKDMNSGVVSGDVGGYIDFYTNDGNAQGTSARIQAKYENAAGGTGIAFEVGTGAGTTERVRINNFGQMQFSVNSSDRTALYFKDSGNSNYAVSGYESATYNGGTNMWYTQNSTHFGIKTSGSMGFFMKHDTRQVTLSYSGQNYPGDTSKQLTVGYSLGNNKGGIYMPTYSYYSDVQFRVVNNDTNNGRQHDDFFFQRNGTRHGGIRIIGGSGVSYQSISDYREKTDEKPIEDAIGTIKKLKPYNFMWKKSGVRQDGFFAHEVDEILDYAVSGKKDATKTYEGVVLNKEGNMIASEIKKEDFDKRLDDGDDEEASPKGETTYPEGSTWKETYEDIEPQQMDPAKLVPVLTAALQEAIKRIEVLESK